MLCFYKSMLCSFYIGYVFCTTCRKPLFQLVFKHDMIFKFVFLLLTEYILLDYILQGISFTV